MRVQKGQKGWALLVRAARDGTDEYKPTVAHLPPPQAAWTLPEAVSLSQLEIESEWFSI